MFHAEFCKALRNIDSVTPRAGSWCMRLFPVQCPTASPPRHLTTIPWLCGCDTPNTVLGSQLCALVSALLHGNYYLSHTPFFFLINVLIDSLYIYFKTLLWGMTLPVWVGDSFSLGCVRCMATLRKVPFSLPQLPATPWLYFPHLHVKAYLKTPPRAAFCACSLLRSLVEDQDQGPHSIMCHSLESVRRRHITCTGGLSVRPTAR